MRRDALRFHLFGEQQHFKLDIQRPALLIGCVKQIVQRLRITFWPGRLRGTEWRQRLSRHHPGRNAGGKTLRQKRTQRLVFPRLQVPRRPVIEQAEASDMLGRLANGNRLANRIARADPHAHLQLIIQAFAGAELRNGRTRGQGLAIGTFDGGVRDADGRGAAVITDGHVLVVRQQRIVWAE